MTEAPKKIWLEPFCEDAEVAWCEHQLEDCDECGEKAVEYILAAEHARILAEKDARWSKNLRENYDAFSAMRNDLNETIGDMASQESTLSIGPTMEAECVAVVSAVTRAVSDMRAEIARLTAERDGIAALTVERCAEVAREDELKTLASPDYDENGASGYLHGQEVAAIRIAVAIRRLSPIPPHVAAARVVIPIFKEKHRQWALSKGRDPADYVSTHSYAVEDLLALALMDQENSNG